MATIVIAYRDPGDAEAKTSIQRALTEAFSGTNPKFHTAFNSVSCDVACSKEEATQRLTDFLATTKFEIFTPDYRANQKGGQNYLDIH